MACRKGGVPNDQGLKGKRKGEAEASQEEHQPSTSGRTHTDKAQQKQGEDSDFQFARIEFEDKK